MRAAHKWSPAAASTCPRREHPGRIPERALSSGRWPPIRCIGPCNATTRRWLGDEKAAVIRCFLWERLLIWPWLGFCSGWEQMPRSAIPSGAPVAGKLRACAYFHCTGKLKLFRQTPMGLAKWLNRRESHAEAVRVHEVKI